LNCPGINFDITVTAGFYSQLAGVLAGFAFTALMFLAATRVSSPERGHAFADAIRILVAAFISLVLTSLDYAIFAGEPSTLYKFITSGEPIIGVGFAVSGALVIYAIVLTLDAATRLVVWPSAFRPNVGTSTRHLLAAVIAPLLMYYIVQAVQQDYEVARYGGCHGTVPLDYLGWGLLFAQMIISWVEYPLLFSRRTAKPPEVITKCAMWTSRLLLAISFGSAVAIAIVGAELRQPGQDANPIVPAVCLIVMFLAMSGMTWQLAYTAPVTRHSKVVFEKTENWQELDHWHVEGLEPRLLRRIRQDFAEPRSAEVFELLSTLEDGSASVLGVERLQTAVLIISRGDFQELLRVLEMAHEDWRAVLEAGGLQYDDWALRLDQELGFPDS